jgi:predicted nucleotidyltransferase
MTGDDPGVILRPASRRLLASLVGGRRSLTELAEAAGVAKPSVIPTLRRLEEQGWVEREDVRGPTGREVFYRMLAGTVHVELRPENGCIISWASQGRIDSRFPLTAQITDLAVREEVLTALRIFSRRLRRKFHLFAVVLFGSAARGQVTWKSDIDLGFIFERDGVADAALEALYEAAAEAQEFVSHPVRVHPIMRSALLAGTGTMIQEVSREGIVLIAEREDPIWPKMARHRTISS